MVIHWLSRQSLHSHYSRNHNLCNLTWPYSCNWYLWKLFRNGRAWNNSLGVNDCLEQWKLLAKVLNQTIEPLKLTRMANHSMILTLHILQYALALNLSTTIPTHCCTTFLQMLWNIAYHKTVEECIPYCLEVFYYCYCCLINRISQHIVTHREYNKDVAY